MKEHFACISSVYPPGRACYNVYSFDDTPTGAVGAARLAKQGLRFSVRFCDLGREAKDLR